MFTLKVSYVPHLQYSRSISTSLCRSLLGVAAPFLGRLRDFSKLFINSISFKNFFHIIDDFFASKLALSPLVGTRLSAVSGRSILLPSCHTPKPSVLLTMSSFCRTPSEEQIEGRVMFVSKSFSTGQGVQEPEARPLNVFGGHLII